MKEDYKFVFVISYKNEGYCSYVYSLVSCVYVCVCVCFYGLY